MCFQGTGLAVRTRPLQPDHHVQRFDTLQQDFMVFIICIDDSYLLHEFLPYHVVVFQVLVLR